MPSEIVEADTLSGPMQKEPRHQLVASLRHSVVFLAIVAAVTLAGFAAQNRQVAGGGLVESHTNVIPLYVSAIVMN